MILISSRRFLFSSLHFSLVFLPMMDILIAKALCDHIASACASCDKRGTRKLDSKFFRDKAVRTTY